METINHPDFDSSGNNENKKCKDSKSGRALAGVFVIGVGCVFLARQLGFVFPHWFFSWEMFLIALGVFLGFRNMFAGAGWWILILIGGIFMLDEIFLLPELRHLFWPVIIILAGIFMIIRPGRNKNYASKKGADFFGYGTGSNSPDDYLDYTSVFGGVKKNITSKQFSGGEVNCVFGGAELNLLNADFSGVIKLELNAVFGGIKLIVPPNWEVKSEIVAILGGVDDKRNVNSTSVFDNKKVLVLEGNCVFGGIDIRSY